MGSRLFPPLERVGIFNINTPSQNDPDLVDCAIYPRMYKLLITADFDGKGLNKNTAESIFLTKG
jgi:hypothetical protein